MLIRRFLTYSLVLTLIFLSSPVIPALADSLPESTLISDVEGHPQGYNLSCESRSAADWAAFWGVEISESEFLSNLPRSDNPDIGFVGDPDDPWGYSPPYSYGVHAGPVAALLRSYGLQAEAQHGLKWKKLRKEVAAGRPVILWVIGQMWRGNPRSYTASDGSTAQVAPFEHTMILIGYDSARVNVVDAYSGRNLTYPLETFLASWSVLGNMAILGKGVKAKDSPATRMEQRETTYTVQPGDYLVALASQLDTTWQDLVELNDIPYPYTIYPGQVLNLSEYSRDSPASSVPPPQTSGESEASESNAQSELYIVKRGDYLAKVAREVGVDWSTLAALNGIGYPYIIYAGQVLRLK
ncbi:MAG: LysM peptidoglycan-binding domain-containing protein [Anaerolineales bacterium]|jgi:uncharacterized protein YvpB/LysM repeat protein